MSFHGLDENPVEPMLYGFGIPGLMRASVEFELPDGQLIGMTLHMAQEDLQSFWNTIWPFNIRAATGTIRRTLAKHYGKA